MISRGEIELLQSDAVRMAIEQNIESDPLRIALDKRLPNAALVASQVKYLQRAQRKLPSYRAARCIIPPLAFEQSSSEQTAVHKDYGGRLCVDLTCGLGVDSLHFSKRFERVIAVERDPVLAEVARINFERMGVGNVIVVNMSAIEFVERFVNAAGQDDQPHSHADLIYADPDRRGGDGRKLVVLEDCSPDVVALLPLMRRAADKIVIKTSPLFDVAEAFRLFGRHCLVDVVSLGGECKEVLIELDDNIAEPCIRASAIGLGQAGFPYERPEPPLAEFAPPYGYMVVPDVSLRKARVTAAYFSERMQGAYVTPGDGYVFANELPDDAQPLLGRVFAVAAMSPYVPRQLKKELKERSIKSAEIYLHGFPHSVQQICGSLGIREGGGAKLAFTKIGGGLWTLELKELTL